VRYLPQLAALAAVWLVVVIAPGPNFVAAVTVATTGSRRAGVRTAVGFAVGDATWAISSLLGLAVLVDRYRWLAELVRFGGAALLVVLGVRSVLRARRHVEDAPPAPSRFRSPLLTGLLVDLGNPKAAVFFTSLFAALLPAGAPGWVGVVAVAEVAAVPALWYSGLACLFSAGRVLRGYRAQRRPIDALVGGIFVALGVRLATTG
jgi:threonine efflux protein